jgi:hypothetical protein
MSESNRHVFVTHADTPIIKDPENYAIFTQYSDLQFSNRIDGTAYSTTHRILGKWRSVNNTSRFGLVAGVVWIPDTLNPCFYFGRIQFVVEFTDDTFIHFEKIHMKSAEGLILTFEYDDEAEFSITIRQNNEEPMLFATADNIHIDNMKCSSYKINFRPLFDFPNFHMDIIMPITSADGLFEPFQNALNNIELRWYLQLARDKHRHRPVEHAPADRTEDVLSDATTRPDIICKFCKSHIAKFVMCPCGHPYCCGACYTTISESYPDHLTNCIICKSVGALTRVYL